MHETETEAQFGYTPLSGLEAPRSDDVTARLNALTEQFEYVTTLLESLLVVSLRSYDALMALVESTNPDEARILHAKHTEGEFFSPPILIPRPSPSPEDEQ